MTELWNRKHKIHSRKTQKIQGVQLSQRNVQQECAKVVANPFATAVIGEYRLWKRALCQPNGCVLDSPMDISLWEDIVFQGSERQKLSEHEPKIRDLKVL